MTNFFLAVPNKLEGKVRIELAYRAVDAYLTLELSNAVSNLSRGGSSV